MVAVSVFWSLTVAFVARLQSTLTVYPRSGPNMWPIIIETMTFFNPEIPGLSQGNPGISGLEKWAGIPESRDPGSRDCNP